ncbi:MAG: guanylate kinase [Candidatus Margulisiibacteriota bacterium]
MLIVVAGPSGVGKGTVIRELLKKMPELHLEVSYTTRKPRPNEKNGIDYYFVSEKEFDKIDFLESAEVHGNKYGTANREFKKDTVFEVDVQGARSIKENRPDCLSIFLLPPSPGELEERLRKRNTENPEDISTRMETAKKELKQRFDHDYIIVNNVLEHTVDKVLEVIKLEKKRKGSVKHE